MLNMITVNSQTQLQEFCQNKILQGPFSELYITPTEHWGGGDIMAKWLGTYEQPIHPAIYSELSKPHDLFINIGCGDGYYGAGVAIKSPTTRILFIEKVESCNQLVDQLCVENNITNYTFSTQSNSDFIESSLKDSKQPWMLMDIEGAEVDLLDLDKIPSLKKTTIIVEAHDFCRMQATNIMLTRFQDTHHITNIVDPITRYLNTLSQSIALSENIVKDICLEGRPCVMNWLYMQPK